MAHIAFLTFANQAHIAPAVPIIAELRSRGHRITCMAAKRFAEPLESAGAKVVNHQSGLANLVLTPDYGAQVPLMLLEENRELLKVARECMESDRPDIIVYDLTVFQAARILMEKWSVPAVQLVPVLASNEHFSLAAKMIEAAPNVDPQHPALLEFFSELSVMLAENGMGAVSVEEFLGRIEEVNVVFLPKEFQVEGDTFDNRFVFVGPCEVPSVPTLSWQPDGTDPVLLATLGSTYNDDPGFFRTCIDAFADQPWQLVLAVGDRIDLADLGPLPANVQVHRWIPYGEVLAHTSALICHAGLTGVLKAFEAGTPVIAVPQAADNMANAERIAELGLGRILRPERFTPESLRSTVQAVMADAETARRIRDMGSAIERAGGTAAAAEVIERRQAVARD